jgi:hypothetical protein
LKIKGLSKDRSPKPFEIGDAVFYIKPADQNMRSTFMSKSIANITELFSNDTKRYFAKTHVTGWDGLVVEERGEQVVFDTDTAVKLLTDEQLDDLFYELFIFACQISLDAEKNQSEDAKLAKIK